MNEIRINTRNPYKIFIEDDLINYAHKEIKKIIKSEKVVLISDSLVRELYLEALKRRLESVGLKVFEFVFENGERSKTLKTVYRAYNFLYEKNITRSDCLIALGGGVVGDVTGFIASTYLRGLNYINIPTTLLAQVDSCVGGKTGVNLDFGKNLVGTFYSPKAIFIDPKVLKTLDKCQISDGMAEVIKYGLIKGGELFLNLERGLKADVFNKLIYECLKVKIELIEKDEFDENERMMLNLGHTMGHAVEKYYNFKKYSHGQAVAIGMLYITFACKKWGITSNEVYNRVKNVLKKYDLLFEEFLFDEILLKELPQVRNLVDISLNDKKVRGNNINLVLIKNIGECFIKNLSLKEFKKFMLGEDIL